MIRHRMASLARHGRSFHFAARCLPVNERLLIADVYAFCRHTDDVVDEARGVSAAELNARLDVWCLSARDAYRGYTVADPLVTRVMHTMRERAVPFSYVEELVQGIRMDIGVVRYADVGALHEYTQRVAGVVGLWIAALYDVRDAWMLERASLLGRSMQLTNIVRDVGADWRMGRLYVPQSLLKTYGVVECEIDDMCAGRRPISPAYRATMEALMTTADVGYARAADAIAHLPPQLARTMAIAADVYRGIHDEVRRNGYDTLTRRAVTSSWRKIALAAHALRGLSARRRAHARAGIAFGAA